MHILNILCWTGSTLKSLISKEGWLHSEKTRKIPSSFCPLPSSEVSTAPKRGWCLTGILFVSMCILPVESRIVCIITCTHICTYINLNIMPGEFLCDVLCSTSCII